MLPGRFQGVHGGFAVVDLEATGSSSRRNRVVEVAVVLLDAELTVEGEFSTLVDPEGPVGPTHIHGIEHHHVLAARAPRFAQIAPQLLRLLCGRVLVGHNVGCDRAFLAAEYARIGVEFPAVPEMCTMRMAALRGALPGALSLRACAQAAGVTGWSAHTALGDARATARLFTRYVTEPVERHSHARQPYAVGAVVKAAALDWPQMAAVEAPWVGRRSTEVARSRNVPAQQIVSYVGNESA